MLKLITVCVFLLTILLLGQLIYLLSGKQRLLRERLRISLSDSQKEPVSARITNPTRNAARLVKTLSVPGTVIGRHHLSRIQSNLTRAGIPLKSEELLTLIFLCSLAVSGIGYLCTNSLAAVALLIILNCAAPMVLIDYLISRRMNKLESQLLDAVMLMANSLRGGYSFLQSLELVSRETGPPLSDELGKVVRETKVGMSLEISLDNLSKRIGTKDIELIVTAVLLQRQVGGNLAVILDTVADTIDKRIKMRGKIKTLTAQGRMTAWIISLLPIGLGAMIFIKYPEFGKIMFTETKGMVLLAVGALMLVIGILLVRKVVKIDV